MRKNHFGKLLAGFILTSLIVTGCGSEGAAGDSENKSGKKAEKTVAIVTDVGGVDDKSFNQSAWEGLQEWGEEHGYEKGTNGYNYLHSKSDSEYITNLNTAAGNGFSTIFGIGHRIKDAVEEVADQKNNVDFVIIDAVIDGKDNVTSVTFRDNEAAFLAGIAAAKTTKTQKVGFVGGQNGEVIDRFEAGFRQGVAAVDEKIEVDVQYVGTFGDPAKAKSQAAAMFNGGADIIFHAAGNSGNGVFSEARDIKKNDPDRELWVIGVDRDQSAEGEVDGMNITLTSTLKGVGKAVIEISNMSLEDKFPGGEKIIFGLAEEGVDLTDGQLSDETKAAVEEFKQQIIDGKITVMEKPSELK
ncbi:BMP family lipoprotein [Vagococcus elongatus]|uniref:BMP family ABC transporter substrate-binding protein n=1 Tax=Vagococcus elongatus TaxID=180344 RepID=A0A430AN71_9ENTE|nr:BMP family protein [Vagococcus elongatus]RSU09367.1 BMP family ABC transporter substrate-binding protein [Vagococcus elongatus]